MLPLWPQTSWNQKTFFSYCFYGFLIKSRQPTKTHKNNQEKLILLLTPGTKSNHNPPPRKIEPKATSSKSLNPVNTQTPPAPFPRTSLNLSITPQRPPKTLPRTPQEPPKTHRDPQNVQKVCLRSIRLDARMYATIVDNDIGNARQDAIALIRKHTRRFLGPEAM